MGGGVTKESDTTYKQQQYRHVIVTVDVILAEIIQFKDIPLYI